MSLPRPPDAAPNSQLSPRSAQPAIDALIAPLEAGGEVLSRDGYQICRLRELGHAATFNQLLLSETPKSHQVRYWMRAFRQEFGDIQATPHQCLTWSGLDEEAALAFREAGFAVFSSTVHSTTSVIAARNLANDVTITPLTSNDHWAALNDHETVDGPPHIPKDIYHSFVAAKNHWNRSWVEAGRGAFFAILDDGGILASLGIFITDAGLARYQSVLTQPGHRRKGLCAHLLHHAGHYAIHEHRAHTLTIISDKDGSASRLYQHCGLVPVASLTTALLRPAYAGGQTIAPDKL